MVNLQIIFLYILVFSWFFGLLFLAIGGQVITCMEDDEEENNIQEQDCV
jgi:hypothetical protein